jgi:hypothetical protein
MNISQSLDYTIMMWLRPFGSVWQQQSQTIFGFNNSLKCYFNGQGQALCDSPKSPSMISMDLSSVQANRWIHFSITGNQSTSLSMVVANDEMIDSDTEAYVDLT